MWANSFGEVERTNVELIRAVRSVSTSRKVTARWDFRTNHHSPLLAQLAKLTWQEANSALRRQTQSTYDDIFSLLWLRNLVSSSRLSQILYCGCFQLVAPSKSHSLTTAFESFSGKKPSRLQANLLVDCYELLFMTPWTLSTEDQ